jgi:Ca2+-binding RTX toxin-like protein
MPSLRLTALAALLAAAALVAVVPGRAEARTFFCKGEEATIVGTRRADVLIGTDGDDVIVARKGADVVFAGEGDDLICTGAGDDIVFAGPGTDLVYVQSGDDYVYGGPGYDRMWGGAGDDLIEGGPGKTMASGNKHNDELWGTWCTPPTTMQHFCRWPDLPSDAPVPDDWILGKAPTLRTGDYGGAVYALQRTLDDLGHDPGPIDGVYGPLTESAVRSFQSDAGIEVDGVTGPSTKRALFGDVGDRKVLKGGHHFDTCNGANRKRGCESHRGLRPGAPWNSEAAEEWRPLIADVFTEWGLEDEIDHAVAVVACESLADPMITTPTGSGHYWIGLFQHTDRYWDARTGRAGIDGASPYDPRSNATVAALLVAESEDSSRGPWAHFGCGKLLGFWYDG